MPAGASTLPIQLRPPHPGEERWLAYFLYLAIYTPPGQPMPPTNLIWLPNLRIYHQGFGTRPGDLCLYAFAGATQTSHAVNATSRPIGAAWARLLPAGTNADGSPRPAGYGSILPNVPELSIAIRPAWRGQGVGTRLLGALLSALAQNGYAQCSLSVQAANPALRLYQRIGFSTVHTHGDELAMLWQAG